MADDATTGCAPASSCAPAGGVEARIQGMQERVHILTGAVCNNNCLARFDHQTHEVRLYKGGPNMVMSEFVFAPRTAVNAGISMTFFRRRKRP